MDRVVGIETEYGCLVSGDDAHPDAWPPRVKNHIFRNAGLGALDVHYRDYEEPPGNGGFLCNGGRLYIDMGHMEYASPESSSLRDVVSYDLAGDLILQRALDEMNASGRIAFIKNNIDHLTGATFGCHENYLMRRDLRFTPEVVGTLLSFLATRQIFTGAGRVGRADPLAFTPEAIGDYGPVGYQISQRADHIVNDIYQWVQFNRAIINARDEPLADHRRYRRLHLLIGDSNVSPFATALKVGTTACLLTLLEQDRVPKDLSLADAVVATRALSRSGDVNTRLELETGQTRSALELQRAFLEFAGAHLTGRDEETDWILESWGFTLDALAQKPELLIGGVDWVSKKWLLDAFRESEKLDWDDPWMQSLDLEYHHIDPARGLFHALEPAKRIAEFNASVRRPETMTIPPQDSRARGRGEAVAELLDRQLPYVINWDSIAIEGGECLAMPDPFKTYHREVQSFLSPTAPAKD